MLRDVIYYLGTLTTLYGHHKKLRIVKVEI